MDEKILKWTARTIAALTVAACVLLTHFPEVKVWLAQEQQRRQEAAQRRAEEEAQKEAVLTAQIEALMERRAQENAGQEQERETEEVEKVAGVISEEETGHDYQLRIELPEGTAASDVKVTNNYVRRQIRITFPSRVEDYFSRYQVQGSNDGIDSMTYYLKGGKGSIELTTDGVYEVSDEVAEGNVFLELTDPRELYDRIVVIDAGHGGEEKVGAVKEGIEEKDLNLGIVRQLKALYDGDKDRRFGVFYTRLKDDDIDLEERVGLANALKADLFISVHNNSTASTSAAQVLRGTQVLYDEADSSVYSSKGLARICLEEVTAALGSRQIGLLEGDDIYIIRNSQMPVALIEVGFMTNSEELALLASEDYQKKAAQGIYNAIARAVKEGY